jgi:hypothetical protein
MKFTRMQCALENSGAWRRWLTGLLAVLMAPAVFAQATNVFLPPAVQAVSTIPANGDVNPYGVAFVPNNFVGAGAGTLQPGDILVSNFNNSQNLQGTGTTIVHIPQSGSPSLFFQGTTQQMGLTTALNIVHAGFILVGSFPSPTGLCSNSTAGSLLVINANGQLIQTITGWGINGPWDMTVNETGSGIQAFIANGLAGNVIRLDLTVTPTGLTVKDSVVVASGYQFQCDVVTFVDAPTGLVYDSATGTLYVASTVDNAVFAVPNAGSATGSQGTGTIIYQDPMHLHGALAMAMAPNGHLLVTNNDAINSDPSQPSEIVEFTKGGQFVKETPVDPNQGGSFGLQVRNLGNGTSTLAAVDDNTDVLFIWPALPN